MINLISALRAYFTAKSVTHEIIKEAHMPTVSGKPGWKTTEFWMDAATKIGILWGSVQGFIPPKWAAIIATAGTAVYVVARTIAKAVSDIQTAKSGTPTA